MAFYTLVHQAQDVRGQALVDTTLNGKKIPPERIWSNRIPHTGDIFKLEPNAPEHLMALPRERRSQIYGSTLTQQIDKELGPNRYRTFSKSKALPRLKMFAVQGQGPSALAKAHDVIVNGTVPSGSFTRGDDISLVFYSHWSPPIHFQRVTRTANKLIIAYQLVPKPGTLRNGFGKVHLALIPVADVAPDRLEVELHRIASPNPQDEQGFLSSDSDFESVDLMISQPCRILVL